MDLNVVEKIDDLVKVNHVLVSVSDKTGLEKLVPAVREVNPSVRFYSTGGTFRRLQEVLGDSAQQNLIAVSDYTKQPEMQGGLVKTLDFKIYLGLLSETYNDAHNKDIERVSGVNFDMVVVNLYPFKQTVAKPDVTPEQARGNIDIGGPCMVRAAAKNYLRVASVTDPADYEEIARELKERNGCISFRTRFQLAQKAFTHTAGYDTAIAKYLNEISVDEACAVYKMAEE